MELTVDFSQMICGLCGLYVYIRKNSVSQIWKKKLFFSSQVLKEKITLVLSSFYFIRTLYI